eukprot:TRINITY_DN6961_c0_g1_i4.p1 TRINITY_DN6961_c0_g1~~TRINITY_DN6961_c0_g1_i4.p1  ORF type:complete len:189 (+),score=37.30 TRINITY_DN6961_c0_g1_i4:63-629(+)
MQKARCEFTSVPGHHVTGWVQFEETDQGTLITAEVQGLSPGKHGFHVHEKSSIANKCKASGSHFNPDGNEHGAPGEENSHAGDMGNLEADSDGTATYRETNDKMKLSGKYSVMNRAVVIHAKEDDLGKGDTEESKLKGSSGDPIACCVLRSTSGSGYSGGGGGSGYGGGGSGGGGGSEGGGSGSEGSE